MFRNKKYRSNKKNLSQILSQSNSDVAVGQASSTLSLSGPLKDKQNIEHNQAPVPAKLRKPNEDEDIFSIPASQQATQRRYVSQRSCLGGGNTQSTSQLIKNLPKSFYEKVLVQCGVILDNDECFILESDHLTFVNKVRQVLKTSANLSENFKEFLMGLQDSIKTNAALTKLLSGCKIHLPNSDISKQTQESLFTNFLMIDFIQTDLIDILFAKLKTFAIDEASVHLEVPYIALMLSQLKFVDQLRHGDQLYKNIFDIFEIATKNAKNEIIINIEDLIDIMRHNEVVEKLMELLPNDEQLLTQSTIDTFSNMCINSRIHSEIRTKIIRYIKNGAPKTLLPSFTKFILKINKDEMETFPDIITELRHCLKWDKNQDQAEVNANQMEVFNCISRSIIRSNKLFEIWLKSIQMESSHHKPIDFLILLLMMSINDGKSNYIENIIRRKIKLEQFNVKLLEETASDFSIILIEYSNTFLELMDNFFRDKHYLISYFGSKAYRLIFEIKMFDKKLIICKLVAFVCERHIISNRSNSIEDLTTTALNVLSDITKKHTSEINKNVINGLKILNIFDQSNGLTIAQFRMVMNVICSLAYPCAPLIGPQALQDHVDMLMKKQISNSILSVKNQGVVGVVRVIDHTIWEESNAQIDVDTDDTFAMISDIPDISAQVAATYIDLILISTSSCAESLALCYDELAAVMSLKNKQNPNLTCVNKYFLAWVCDLITNDFQTFFIVEATPDGCGMPLEYTYCINSIEDNTNPESEVHSIGINIAGCVLKPSSIATSSITILPSLFNLMRTLHIRKNEGDLEAINAVLGCALVLPKCFGEDTDIFEEFDEKRVRKILDIYYYTVNWMREVINGFANQVDSMIRKKVLRRLTDLIKIENTIKLLLIKAPSDYIPPNSDFRTDHSSVSKFIKPAVPTKQKLQKKTPPNLNKTNADTEHMTELLDTVRTQDVDILTCRQNAARMKNIVSASFQFSYGPKEVYRNMDTDIMILLKENLRIVYELPTNIIGAAIGLQEFKFIMEDLVIKMESIFGVKKMMNNQSWQYVIFPIAFVMDLVKYLPNIVQSLIKLIDHLKQKLVEVNHKLDHTELFTNEINLTKICIGLCLRLLAAFFTWPNFDDNSYKDLLTISLHAIVYQTDYNSDDEKSTSELALDAINNIISYENVLLDLRSAVHMFHLAKSLLKYCDDENKGHDCVANLCKKLLSRVWYTFDGSIDRGAQCNLFLDELLKGFLRDAKLNDLKKLLHSTLEEIKRLNKKDDTLKTFPCFYKANFPLFYRSLCASLITSVNKKIVKSGPTIAQLRFWEKSFDLLNALLDIVRNLHIPRNFNLFLRHANIFLKIFLQHGMPLIEVGLRKNPERINNMLKSIQNTTRFLHNLCCHSKAIKVTSNVAQIPSLRETVENLVFRVKATLAANKCSTVFWMGNLKNKDLHGDEILSQLISENSSVDPEMEEDDELENSLEEEQDDVNISEGVSHMF